MGVGKMGQILGKMGVGEMGVIHIYSPTNLQKKKILTYLPTP